MDNISPRRERYYAISFHVNYSLNRVFFLLRTNLKKITLFLCKTLKSNQCLFHLCAVNVFSFLNKKSLPVE